MRNPFRHWGKPAGLAGLIAAIGGFLWVLQPSKNWPDRRPIGALFLADHTHTSRQNPRGWFNDPQLDVRGPEGSARFRQALLGYAGKSIEILLRTGAQGMIVWDLEGEEFPHKTTYIGDPRLLDRMAPEAAAAADEFFKRFRTAGLRVGLTVRPQELIFDSFGAARQRTPADYDRILLDKIDYARSRWGATLFYVDSNGGPLWPAEVFRLRRMALRRPDILLIPEHHDPLYYAFSAPYGSMQTGAGSTSRAVRMFFPNAFRVLAIPDSSGREAEIEQAYRNRDVLLFRAWFGGPATRFIETLSKR